MFEASSAASPTVAAPLHVRPPDRWKRSAEVPVSLVDNATATGGPKPRVPVHTVADETWSAALEAGWSERELLEGYAEVVRTIMTNYVNHLVGTELDLPAAPALD